LSWSRGGFIEYLCAHSNSGKHAMISGFGGSAVTSERAQSGTTKYALLSSPRLPMSSEVTPPASPLAPSMFFAFVTAYVPAFALSDSK